MKKIPLANKKDFPDKNGWYICPKFLKEVEDKCKNDVQDEFVPGLEEIETCILALEQLECVECVEL